MLKRARLRTARSRQIAFRWNKTVEQKKKTKKKKKTHTHAQKNPPKNHETEDEGKENLRKLKSTMPEKI